MRNMRRSVGVGILIGLLALLFCPHMAKAGEAGPQMQDTLNAVIKRGELLVGTYDYFAPWGFRDAQNNIAGMDPEIGKELADVLKVKLTLVPVPTNQDRINFLLTGKIDVAISNFTATLERSKVITFTDPYVIDGIGVIFRKEANIKNWADLNGKRVSVVTGSTGEITAKEQAPKATLLRFDQASQALLAVQQGKADAYVQDYSFTLYHAGRDPNKSLDYIKQPLGFQPYCMGVRKFDPEWLHYLNFFIYRLHQTGKMKELYKKWFNAEPMRVSPTW